MSDHPYRKIIGFLNGLDYYSEDKNSKGHSRITKSAIVYLLENQCSKQDLENCFEMLSRNNKLTMKKDFMTSTEPAIGYLFGWIDTNSLDIIIE